jgi:hypothetical protein
MVDQEYLMRFLFGKDDEIKQILYFCQQISKNNDHD